MLTEEQALHRSLHSVSDADKRWAGRKAEGRTDVQLKEDIGDEFGIWGGSGDESHAGGKNPKFWYQKTGDKPTLQGAELIRRVRSLLKIPTPQDKKQRTLW